MIEKLNNLIESSIQEFAKELKKDNLTEQQIRIIRGRVINKVKLAAKGKLNIDLFNNPDYKLIKHLEKQVDLVINNYKHQSNNIKKELDNDINIKEMIEIFSKQIELVNKFEEKGKYKEATIQNGRIIRKLKEVIKNIKAKENLKAKDLDNLEKIEIFLDEQLEWHKIRLNERNQKEALKERDTSITVLPQDMGLQVQKIIICIDQLKESTINKERIFNVIELGKEMGLFALSPIIIGVKYTINLWYLLLLLLMMLKFPKGYFKRKQPKKDRQQFQRVYAPEPIFDVIQERVETTSTEAQQAVPLQ